MIRVTAVLLVMAFFVFLIGAGFWLVGEFEQPLAARLRAVAIRRRRWIWIHWWMVAGTIASVAAVTLLVQLLRDDRGALLATAGQVLFATGGLAFLGSLAVGLTGTPVAASVFVRTGEVPPAYLSWHRLGNALYVLHMLLSYATFAFLGAAMLNGSLLPAWLGWFGVALGVVALVGFLLTRGGPFAPPILAHSFGLLVGIVMLIDS
jgi:hypothetical protein